MSDAPLACGLGNPMAAGLQTTMMPAPLRREGGEENKEAAA
ncbi:hypothetical protein [Streptomyces humicola]|nr:hypothetical protein [Streptomyces humicola]